MTGPDLLRASGAPGRGFRTCGAGRHWTEAEPVFAGSRPLRRLPARKRNRPYTAAVAVTEAGFSITGRTSRFSKPADSENTLLKVFYPVFAATLDTVPATKPALILIRAGTLDDASQVVPQANLFAPSAPPSDKPDPSITAFDRVCRRPATDVRDYPSCASPSRTRRRRPMRMAP